MLNKPHREKDPPYIYWLRKQPEFRCLLTGSADADACHLRSKGAGGSDYFVFPLAHELHMKLDHSPRKAHTDSRIKQEMALWYYHLKEIHRRYYREQMANGRTEILAHPTMQDLAQDTLGRSSNPQSDANASSPESDPPS